MLLEIAFTAELHILSHKHFDAYGSHTPNHKWDEVEPSQLNSS